MTRVTLESRTADLRRPHNCELQLLAKPGPVPWLLSCSPDVLHTPWSTLFDPFHTFQHLLYMVPAPSLPVSPLLLLPP